MISPVLCSYAPPGEYIKDHTLVFHDGWWHLFSISGTWGYSHLYNGNEETISWSISRDLVHWDFRGHVLHASCRAGEFDQHEVWAPFCLAGQGVFRLYYTGVVHPHRPMCYEMLGTNHPDVSWDGHRETLGLAVSEDFTAWTKVSDPGAGLGIPGRDPHVVYDEDNGRWLLYSTGKRNGEAYEEYVSQSADLQHWQFIGVCARFPSSPYSGYSTTESITVMKHPASSRWVMLGNWQYALSDDPLDFTASAVRGYFEDEDNAPAKISRLGFAGEMIQWGGKWYRSGVLGKEDRWVLGFHEIEWDGSGAFSVIRPSIVE